MNHRVRIRFVHGFVMGTLACAWLAVFSWISVRGAPVDILVAIFFAAIYGEFEYRRVKIQIPGWDSPGLPATQPRTITLSLSAVPLTVAALITSPLAGICIALTTALVSLASEIRWHREHDSALDTQSCTDIFFNVCLATLLYGTVTAWAAYWQPLDFSQARIVTSAFALLSLIVLVPVWDSTVFTVLVKVRSGRPLAQVAREMFGPDVLVLGLVVTIGVLGAVAWQVHPLLAVPSLIGCVGARWALGAVATWFADQQQIHTLASQLTATNAELREAKSTLELRVLERTTHIQHMAQQRIDATNDAVHNAKNQLRAVESNADAFFLQTQHNAAQDVFYQRLKRSAASLRDTLIDALDVANMELGVSQLVTQPVSVKQSILAIRSQIAARCAALGVSFTVEQIDDGVRVVGDPRRIERVLYNLCDNAINYSVDYSEQVGQIPWIHIWLSEEDSRIGINITDNGPGLHAADLARLGERGMRLDTHLEGSGMGINFCIRTLALHRGSLGIHSDGPGCGSTFTAYVPAWQDTAPLAAVCANNAHAAQRAVAVEAAP